MQFAMRQAIKTLKVWINEENRQDSNIISDGYETQRNTIILSLINHFKIFLNFLVIFFIYTLIIVTPFSPCSSVMLTSQLKSNLSKKPFITPFKNYRTNFLKVFSFSYYYLEQKRYLNNPKFRSSILYPGLSPNIRNSFELEPNIVGHIRVFNSFISPTKGLAFYLVV